MIDLYSKPTDISAHYAELRHKADDDRRSRISEVYTKTPEIAELDREISTVSLETAKQLVLGGGNISSASEKISGLMKRKRDILVAAGYSADYMELKYSCDICRDTGYVAGEPCNCMKRIITEDLYKQSGLMQVLSKENFDTFSLELYKDERLYEDKPTPYANAKAKLKAAREFVDSFDSEFKNIFLYGETGVGKTFLTNCIAKAIMDRGYVVMYVSANELFEEIASRYLMGRDEELKKYLRRYYECVFTCDLLIIDDLGTEVTNNFVVSELYEIINKRMLTEKSTIISTNYDMGGFRRMYGERVMSRIVDKYDFYILYGDNLRYNK